nr:unnamed protein product [Callosobruchus analis]
MQDLRQSHSLPGSSSSSDAVEKRRVAYEKRQRTKFIQVIMTKDTKEYQYDQANDCIIKPYDFVRVVLIKGIF